MQQHKADQQAGKLVLAAATYISKAAAPQDTCSHEGTEPVPQLPLLSSTVPMLPAVSGASTVIPVLLPAVEAMPSKTQTELTLQAEHTTAACLDGGPAEPVQQVQQQMQLLAPESVVQQPLAAAVATAGIPVASCHQAAAPAQGSPKDMTVDVLHPTFHTVAFGQLEAVFVCELGRGGRGTVLLVNVHRKQLLALTEQTPALKQLLQSSVSDCGCGSASGLHGSGKGHCKALEGDGSTAVAAARVSSGGVSCCSCSVPMALKVAATYDELSHGWRDYYTPQQYAEVAVTDCVHEYKIMLACVESEHIVDCYAFGRTVYRGSERPCVLVEYSEIGDADKAYLQFERMGLSDVATQHIVKQVASGAADLHELASTFHRDIKLSNLLLFRCLESPLVKLCDFGIAKQMSQPAQYGYTVCGTPEYMAPEQADQRVGQDYRVDSWMLGLLVLALRKGRKPFWRLWNGSCTLSLSERLAERKATALDDPESEYNVNDYKGTALGEIEKAFVQRCLTQDISRRPAACRLLATDPYLSRNCRVVDVSCTVSGDGSS